MSQGETSSLFKGKQFWLSQNVPQRTRFKEMIEKHGGIIRLQEKDADIKLVDHTRKNLPEDTFSYRYIETSVRKGKLELLEPYRAGPSNPRPVGATNIPSRGTRSPYTLQDDQELWDFMEPYEKIENAPIRGNKLYQEFAAKNPRHTYQSWRDRYLKRLRGNPRPGGPRPQPPAHEQPSESVTDQRESTPTPPREEARDQSPPRSSKNNRKRKQTADSSDSLRHKVEPPKSKRRAVEKPSSPKSPASTTSRSSRSLDSPSRQLLAIPSSSLPERPSSPRGEATATRDTTDHGESATSQPPPADDADDAVDSFLLELPFLPSSEPEPEPEEQGREPNVNDWIDEHLRTGKTENMKLLVDALRCTSLNLDLADIVLDYFIAGKGIPDDVMGVWTPEDDKGIEAKDTRSVDRVLKKHGMEYFNVRWRYLQMARAKGLED